jgi:hypothetical protein
MDAARNLYVAASTNGVLVFARDVGGNVAPIRTIAGSNTGLANVVAVALDPSNNVFALDSVHHAIYEFATGADGNVAPIHTLMGPKTMLANAVDIRVSRRDAIYVSDQHDVLEFNQGRFGNVKPSRIAQVTGWDRIFGIQIHDSNLEISALANGTGTPGLLDMSQNVNGQVIPARIISGSLTGIGGLCRIKVHDVGR